MTKKELIALINKHRDKIKTAYVSEFEKYVQQGKLVDEQKFCQETNYGNTFWIVACEALERTLNIPDFNELVDVEYHDEVQALFIQIELEAAASIKFNYQEYLDKWY